MIPGFAGLVIGVLIGLFARPFLDAYVMWRAAQPMTPERFSERSETLRSHKT